MPVPMISFRFDALRVTIGGLGISIGPSLLAFDPGLVVPAASIFSLGMILTLSGLFSLPHRHAVIHIRWSSQRILKALGHAPAGATIQILQTWFPEEDFTDSIEHLYLYEGKRFRLRVMLIKPDQQGVNDVLAARVKLRWIERSKAVSDITQTCEALLRLKREVDDRLRELARAESRPEETVDIEIRFYDFMPFGPIYRIGDEVMFVGFYLNHTSSVFGPMIEVRKSKSPQLWRVFEWNLHNGWEASTPYYPAGTRELAHG